ncbi:MAG TPA: hypothetical protein VKA67_00385, partial [Verrucomicrobiae bacterium]|nr:hypothetical protein [Verrucomicrobiae bacterium]
MALLPTSASAQGTAFTYQGQLKANGQPISGRYDFNFQVFDAATAGNSYGDTISTHGVPITNGLFTVTLDFGADVFTGAPRWLQFSVSTNNANNYFTLAPRQQLTPTPYAVYGETAGLANTVANGTISSGQLNTLAPPTSGQVLEFNGTALTWTTPATGTSAWGLAGNAGTTAGVNFLGTTDNQPLEFRANSLRALRLEAATNIDPNISGAMNFDNEGPLLVFYESGHWEIEAE